MVTQKSLYTMLFVVVLILLWFAKPFALIFWLVGSSALLILGHAAFIEPPVSSEYAGVEVCTWFTAHIPDGVSSQRLVSL